jgi:hypothetical protein
MSRATFILSELSETSLRSDEHPVTGSRRTGHAEGVLDDIARRDVKEVATKGGTHNSRGDFHDEMTPFWSTRNNKVKAFGDVI